MMLMIGKSAKALRLVHPRSPEIGTLRNAFFHSPYEFLFFFCERDFSGLTSDRNLSYKEILRSGIVDIKKDDAVDLFQSMIRSRPLPHIIDFSKLFSGIARTKQYDLVLDLSEKMELNCLVGIAVCCCLPCIIAVLYAVADQEGASKEDIEQLTKFKFRKVGDVNKHSGDEAEGNTEGIMTECGTDSPVEHTLLQEDAECCICLSAYEDGTELRELPCGHHFHCSCVDKWLYINATCPLCKYNILKSSNLDREEV